MSHPTPTSPAIPQALPPRALPPRSLPAVDRTLLRLAGHLVPAADRPDWHRAWQAELWHRRNQTVHRSEHQSAHRPWPTPDSDIDPAPDPAANRVAAHRWTLLARTATRLASPWPTADLAPGLLRDALWLRAEASHRVLRGTALLCLSTLLGLCLLTTGISLALYTGPHPLALRLADLAPRVALAASLVVFVTFSVAPRRPAHQTFITDTAIWLRRQIFLAAKLTLLLLLTFLLSTDLTAPLTPAHPLTADFLQILSFVLLALVALRWALADQEARCKHCLRSLSAPARVGRPSRNLLEWNGTELSCKRGHGLLTIPELETSWCQSSQWISNRNNTATT